MSRPWLPTDCKTHHQQAYRRCKHSHLADVNKTPEHTSAQKAIQLETESNHHMAPKARNIEAGAEANWDKLLPELKGRICAKLKDRQRYSFLPYFLLLLESNHPPIIVRHYNSLCRVEKNGLSQQNNLYTVPALTPNIFHNYFHTQ